MNRISMVLAALTLASACVPAMTEPDAGIPDPVEDAGLVLPAAKARKVALANGAACALTTTGTVRCWGWSGQADDTVTERRWTQFADARFTGNIRVPVEVPGITDATDLTSNYQHLCVTTAAKKAKCWGWNSAGQLATGNDKEQMGLIDVPLSNVKKIRVGGEHTCALLEDGTVWCWGSNFKDQLETVPVMLQADRWLPLKVPYVSGATDLFIDGDATCVVMAGDVRCWGALMPMAGASSTDAPPRKLPIPNLSTLSFWTFVACGVQNGAAKCWGHPDDGWLGNGSQFGDPEAVMPVQVKGLDTGVTYAVVGGAVKNGKVFTWGQGYAGNGSGYDRTLVPVEVPGISNAVQVERYGTSFSCAVTANGSVFCWGNNSNGQLGRGGLAREENYLTPEKVLSFE